MEKGVAAEVANERLLIADEFKQYVILFTNMLF
jgi:hypothetical protein